MNFKKKLDALCSNKKTLTVNAVLGLVGCLFYFSEHTMLGFIGYYTFKALPYILGALGIASAVTALILLFVKNNRGVQLATLIYNGFFCLLAVIYFFALASAMARTFLLEMAKLLVLYAFFAAIVYLCFFHAKAEYRGKKIVASVLCGVILVGSLLSFTDFSSLRINFIASDPVVYAVGDEYQIVWTTAAKGSGAVTVGNNVYYDSYAGQMRTDTKVHKVSVPQTILDEEKSYTVSSRAILSEQGFSGLLGYTVKKTSAFRPVDPTDGIQAYFLSDTHDFNSAATKAAAYHGDKLDFLVLGGDHLNFLDDEEHLSRILALGYSVTKGARPVVFARGNHELKCPQSETLDRYVGSRNGKFYYTFRLKNVWGAVLDMGEDHDDDWKEFYGTALYSEYRKEQIAFLDEIIADKENEYEAEGVEYKIGICHIATAISEYESGQYMFEDLLSVNDRLNAIGLDVMLSGHLHRVFTVESGYFAGKPLTYTEEYLGKKSSDTPDFLATGANYPNIICCRHSDSFKPSARTANGKFTGVALEFMPDGKYARFTTQKKEVLFTTSPFEAIEYGRITEL